MVEVWHWNPRRPVLRSRIGRSLPVRRRVNNFGDLLGPLVVEAMLQRYGASKKRGRDVRLLTVGSILHFAETGNVIWGSGVNGKIDSSRHLFEDLDVRAVRGPLTAQFLTDRGISVPEVYGDPALLLPQLLPQLQKWAATPLHKVTVVPNLNDIKADGENCLDPRSPVRVCLERIARSRLVVGSSLHAIVVAESLGIPARAVRLPAETPFKYRDYYEGTGRPDVALADSVADAMRMGGAEPLEGRWTSEPLIRAFPRDLWRAPPT